MSKKRPHSSDTDTAPRPINIERQCGVQLLNDKLCARSLTCKKHTIDEKRAVPGRPQPFDDLYTTYQMNSQAKQQGSSVKGPEVSVPELSSLTTQFSERDALYAHLVKLPNPILVSMLLAQHKGALSESEAQAYGPSNNLGHCVYCHTVFDKSATKQECMIEHFGDNENYIDDDTMEWTCCGKYVSGYTGYHSGGPPPTDSTSPYCYQGVHSDREFQMGDLGAPNGHWWVDWAKSMRSCRDTGCHKKPNGGHLVKKVKRDYENSYF